MSNILILTFHSVMNHHSNRPWSFLSISVEQFECILKYLKKNNYKTITLQDLYDYKTGKTFTDEKLILLHFDDGFLDNYTIVYPMLKQFGYKATVFISPEFVDPRPIVRDNIYKKIKKNEKIELNSCWGYMSWEELKLIDESGVIDVQSHALSHSWYPVSHKIVDLHHKNDSFYWLWWNRFLDKKPFWLTQYSDSDIEYGTPVFQHAKSLSGKRFFVNSKIEDYVIEKCRKFKGLNDKKNRFDFINKLNKEIKERFNGDFGFWEDDTEYHDRLCMELVKSKELIEMKLNKKVKFLAWPGGAYNDQSKVIAKKAKYYSVTAKGKPYNEKCDDPYTIYRVGGWSGIRLFGNKSCALVEKLFIRMQIQRSKGNNNTLNMVLSSLRKAYRSRINSKNIKRGETSNA